MTGEEAHRLARERGASKPLYAVVRGVVVPFMRVWFHLRVEGAEHIPQDGPAIVSPNHKSFWDSFYLGAATRRHIRFMGKVELFEGWYARLLVGLGAFPVRRGEADLEALETARTILRQGGLLALFPEGTRIRDPDSLGEPRKGVGRLALETGAPIVPAAITGTDNLFLGPIPKPKRVQLAFGEPVMVTALDDPTPERAAELVGEQVWPEVERRWSGLRSRPGLIAAGLAAAGLGGLVLQRRRRGAPVLPAPRRSRSTSQKVARAARDAVPGARPSPQRRAAKAVRTEASSAGKAVGSAARKAVPSRRRTRTQRAQAAARRAVGRKRPNLARRIAERTRRRS